MPLIDELEQKYGISASILPPTTPKSGLVGGAATSLINQLELKYGIGSASKGTGQLPPPQPSPQPAQSGQVPVFEGAIQDRSPLSFGQRAALSFGDVKGSVNYLQTLGFEVLNDATGNLLVKKPGEEAVFRVDEKGFSGLDIADMFGKALPTIASIGGTIVGALAGTVAAPGAGTVLGGATGGATGSALGETASQFVGQRLGTRAEGFDPGEIGREAAIGGVGGALAGTGRVIAAGLAPRIGSRFVPGAASAITRQGGTLSLATTPIAQQLESGALRVVPIRAAPTVTRRIAGEALEAGLQTGTITGGETLVETGDVGQAAKAFGAGFALGAPFGPAGYAALGGVGRALRPLASKAGKVIKRTNFVTGAIDKLENPTLASSAIGRSVYRFLAPLSNTIGGLDSKVLRLIKDAEFETMRFKNRSNVALRRFSKVWDTASPLQKEEAWLLLQSNTRKNPALANRSLYTLDELKGRTDDSVIKELIDEGFPVTREISEAFKGRTLRGVGPVGEPAPFAPVRYLDEEITDELPEHLARRTKDITQKMTAEGVDPAVAEAYANEIAAKGRQFGTTPGKMEARKRFFSTVEEAREAGVDMNLVEGYKKWIASETRKAGQFRIFADQSRLKDLPHIQKIIAEKPDISAEDILAATKEDMYSRLRSSYSKIPGTTRKETDKVMDMVRGYTESFLNGKNFNDLTNNVRKFNALKLSFSALRNIYQPMNNALTMDMPTVAAGVAKAYRLDPAALEFAERSGVLALDIIESPEITRASKIVNLVMKPLTVTEDRNRVATAYASLRTAQKFQNIVNDNPYTAEAATALTMLEKMLGKKINVAERSTIVKLLPPEYKDLPIIYPGKNTPGEIMLPDGTLASRIDVPGNKIAKETGAAISSPLPENQNRILLPGDGTGTVDLPPGFAAREAGDILTPEGRVAGEVVPPAEIVTPTGERVAGVRTELPKELINLTDDELERIAFNSVKQTQFGYSALDLPWWSQTDAGAIAFQFKSFAYNQLRLVFSQTVGEMRAGNPARAARNLGILLSIFPAAGQLAMAIDNFFYGEPTDKDENLVANWLSGIAEVGALGILTDVTMAPDGSRLMTGITAGPTGQTLARTVDYISRVVPALAGGDLEVPLEQTLNLGLSQFGGAGRALYKTIQGENVPGQLLF